MSVYVATSTPIQVLYNITQTNVTSHQLPLHYTELPSATTEVILDYLREIIEEGLNLDVTGDALLERFSVQCVSETIIPGVMALAKGLGISRFTSGGISSMSGSQVSQSRCVELCGADGSMVKLHVLDTMALNNIYKLIG
jgi:hypothetical protein